MIPATPVGYLAQHLNDGRRSGFKLGEKIEIDTPRGKTLRGEVWDKGPKRGELWVVVAGVTWLVRKTRPNLWAKPKAKRGRGLL